MTGVNEHNSLRVAVTGSTGMIGSHLVAELVRAGYRDIVLPVRNKAKIQKIYKVMSNLGIEMPYADIFTVMEADVEDSGTMTGVFNGVDTVFHCAAVIMAGEMTEQELIDNNVSLARSVADAALAAGVRRIINTSSIIVFAPSEAKGQVIDEKNKEHEGSCDAYGKSKYLCDLEMKRAESGGVGLTTLYPSVVLGEGDWSINGSSVLVPLISMGIPFYTEGVMSYVDVRDVARAYTALAACGEATGQGFIISSATLSYRELLTLGAKAADKRPPFIRVGKRVLYSGYCIMKALVTLRLMKDYGLCKRKLDSILYGNSYSGKKIEKLCGFEYTPIDRTINRLVGVYLDYKKKKRHTVEV